MFEFSAPKVLESLKINILICNNDDNLEQISPGLVVSKMLARCDSYSLCMSFVPVKSLEFAPSRLMRSIEVNYKRSF